VSSYHLAGGVARLMLCGFDSLGRLSYGIVARTGPGLRDCSVSRKLPLWKKFVFSLIVAVVCALTLEIVLAVAGVVPLASREDPFVGFASRAPLFVEERDSDGKLWMVTAKNKLQLFNEQRFLKSKPAGAYRIFCLGGSTTAGRPYDDDTSFCGWMRELLPEAEPNKDWEVINAGGVSYASYRVSALLEHLVRYDPDMFVIYTGHNEFLEEQTYRELRSKPAVLREAASVLSNSRTYTLLRWAQQANKITNYENAQYLDTLSAAQAASGDFSSAVKWAQKAVEMTQGREQEVMRERLKLYQSGKAFRRTLVR
jgi:hypothetical protein